MCECTHSYLFHRKYYFVTVLFHCVHLHTIGDHYILVTCEVDRLNLVVSVLLELKLCIAHA